MVRIERRREKIKKGLVVCIVESGTLMGKGSDAPGLPGAGFVIFIINRLHGLYTFYHCIHTTTPTSQNQEYSNVFCKFPSRLNVT